MSRQQWVEAALKISQPLYQKFIDNIKWRITAHSMDRTVCSPFEALARTLAGLAPWYQNDPQAHAYKMQAQSAIAEFFLGKPEVTRQSVIDFAYFTMAILTCPGLFHSQVDSVKAEITRFFEETRRQVPLGNNWLLAMAVNELFYSELGICSPDFTRIEYALRMFDSWYKGDAIYGDGPDLQYDYYNSLVVHPFLHTLLQRMNGIPAYPNRAFITKFNDAHAMRLRRYAKILERMISPEGTFPVVGRSATYRMGVFHALGYAELQGIHTHGAQPSMTKVLQRFMAGDIFRADGLLHVGFLNGEQLALAEPYISTGSVYACMLFFLPLGIPDTGMFWKSTEQSTQEMLWSPSPYAPYDFSIGDPLL